jgi:hypothetical protein
LLLLGAGFAAWRWYYSWPRVGDQDSDLAFVPSNAQGFLTLRPADLWKFEEIRDSLKKARELDNKAVDPIALLEKDTGFVPADLERLTVVLPESDDPETWVILRTIAPYDPNELIGRLSSRTEVKWGGKTFHLGRAKTNRRIALYLAGPRVVVAATEAGMKACLGRRQRQDEKYRLADALKRAAGDDPVVVGFGPMPDRQNQWKEALQPDSQPLLDFSRGATLWLRFGKTAEINASLGFENPKALERGRTAYSKTANFLKNLLLTSKILGWTSLDGESVDKVVEILESVQVKNRGSDLLLKATVQRDMVPVLLPVLLNQALAKFR